MDYSIYGNCQSTSLAMTLAKSENFSQKFNYKRLKPIHHINEQEVFLAEDVFLNSDLVIHQPIAKNYRITGLSSPSLMKLRKKGGISITFPSLYFNAYAPHLDRFDGITSVLNVIHDYIVMYCYAKGMNEQETLDLIQSNELYSKELSLERLNSSLSALKARELSIDTTISDFIEKNYHQSKLFYQFNHPSGVVFDNLANQILDMLSIDRIEEKINSYAGLDSIVTPIYRSTYKNLKLSFEEDFNTYKTLDGPLQQDEVVAGFFKTYRQFEKSRLIEQVKMKKEFIIKMFNDLGL